ncbi:MAG: MBL fold metallo-hydrolase [Acidobacteria bacterium]|nr:MBL fold metallo-hydrolase [Acidobacteriota bacterium]
MVPRLVPPLLFLALALAAGPAPAGATTPSPDRPAGRVQPGPAPPPFPVVFVTYVTTPGQDRAAGLLVDSIRAFGGRFRAAPVLVVLTDPDEVPALRLRSRKDVRVEELRLDAAVNAYPYASKAFAAARAEDLYAGSARVLAWFDPETLLLQEPELDLPDGVTLAVRPVQVRNVGLPWDAPPDAFWSALYARCGAEPGRAVPVESFVEGQRLRGYLNCGIFAIRSDTGLLREWARLVDECLKDEAFQHSACSDAPHRIFLHQAVLSALVTARLTPDRIRFLPHGHGYPLNLHARLPAERRAAALGRVVTLHHEMCIDADPAWADALVLAAGQRARLEKIYLESLRVSGPIFREEGSCNSYLVKTPGGSVVIDPGGASSPQSPLRRVAKGSPLKAVLLTHAHEDHRGGIASWKNGASTPVVAQREMVEFLRYHDRLRPFLEGRRAAQGAQPVPAPPGAETPVEATVLFTDRYVLTVGGMRFEMIHVGGETPDQSLIWVPALKAVFIGDNYYASFPNLYTPRGTKPRWALEYVAALEKALALQPELLLPGHGEPLVGRDLVRRKLTRYRDAVRKVHDDVVAGMNAGKDVFTLMREVRLPPELEVPQFYGRVSWSVRGIFEGYAGWFDGNAANLYTLPPADTDAELVRLAGGADAVTRRAVEALGEGDAVRSLRLADAALAAEPGHAGALDARLTALRALLARCTNVIERGWLQSAIRETDRAISRWKR